jgi:hypothetical protein
LGLLVLSWILFGGRAGLAGTAVAGSGSAGEEMTPEQREKLRAGMCGRGGDFGATLAEQKD